MDGSRNDMRRTGALAYAWAISLLLRLVFIEVSTAHLSGEAKPVIRRIDRPKRILDIHVTEAIRIFEHRHRRRDGIETKTGALLVVAGICFAIITDRLGSSSGMALALGLIAAITLTVVVLLILQYYRIVSYHQPRIDADLLSSNREDAEWEVIRTCQICIEANEMIVDSRADLFSGARRYLSVSFVLIICMLFVDGCSRVSADSLTSASSDPRRETCPIHH